MISKCIWLIVAIKEWTTLTSICHHSSPRVFKRFPGSLKRIETEVGLAGWTKDQMFGVLHFADRAFQIGDDVWRDHNGAVSIRVNEIARIDC